MEQKCAIMADHIVLASTRWVAPIMQTSRQIRISEESQYDFSRCHACRGYISYHAFPDILLCLQHLFNTTKIRIMTVKIGINGVCQNSLNLTRLHAEESGKPKRRCNNTS